jgi:diazepam-binding inhibitor (GABA receptor modulator, acyl-CoA-binding protein)
LQEFAKVTRFLPGTGEVGGPGAHDEACHITLHANRHVWLAKKLLLRWPPVARCLFVGTVSRKGIFFMSDLKAAFEKAVADSRNLSERPDNAALLKIYALYKQASAGDNLDKKPGFSDMVARAKWDAWSTLKGTSQDDAMQRYIDLIEELR